MWTGPKKKGVEDGEVDGGEKMACRSKKAKKDANMTICEFM